MLLVILCSFQLVLIDVQRIPEVTSVFTHTNTGTYSTVDPYWYFQRHWDNTSVGTVYRIYLNIRHNIVQFMIRWEGITFKCTQCSVHSVLIFS